MITTITLTYDKIPRQSPVIAADLPMPMEPPLLPWTGEPAGSENFVQIFLINFMEQESSQELVIHFNRSGHGLVDIVGYEKYFQGELDDNAFPEEDLERFTKSMAGYPKPGSA